MARAREKLQVAPRAVLRRINRTLAATIPGHVLKKVRPGAQEAALGPYIVVNGSGIVERNVALEAYARRLGVLASFEAVAREDA